MTPVPLSKVLNENTAYLLSYIRVGESDQGPGARPTSTKSSPMPSRPLANGHSHVNGHGNGNGVNNGTNGSAASSPSMKRKRQWTDDDDSQPATPSRAIHTPPPSDSEEEEPQERTPIKWTYEGNKKTKNLPAPRAQNPESMKISPIDRPSHPSPSGSGRKKDKMRKKLKGAPMPFKQAGNGNGRNGSGGFQKGGKGRHNGKSNGRGPFRG